MSWVGGRIGVILGTRGLALGMSSRNKGGYLLGGVSFRMRSKRVLIVAKPGKNKGSALTGALVNVRAPSDKGVVLSKRSVARLSVGRETGTKVNFTFRRPPEFGKVAIVGLLGLTTGSRLSSGRYYSLLATMKLYTGSCVCHRVSNALSNKRVGQVRVTSILTGRRSLYVFSRPRTKVSL